jgi:hypothetical protein
MNETDFSRNDLIALAESELRPQEAIFTEIGDNGRYRQMLLALMSNSLRQYSRLKKNNRIQIESAH